MRQEFERACKSPQSWASWLVCVFTLMGYSLSYWVGTIIVGEYIEYRESALHLSIGGIFFGGFMLLFPFCSSLAHSTSQVDDLCSGFMQWQTLRGSVWKYVRTKAGVSMAVAAITTASAFVIHAILWNLIALPIDPATYTNHFIYFNEKCIFHEVYALHHGLYVYIEMTIAIAFCASVWAVVGLAIAVWVPDKLLTVAIPSFLYYLWGADFVYYFVGIKIPHPATLFNDGLTVEEAIMSIVIYVTVFILALMGFYIGCERRCRNA